MTYFPMPEKKKIICEIKNGEAQNLENLHEHRRNPLFF